MNKEEQRKEFKEWLDIVKYDNSNILSPQGLAWEAWQAAQKGLTEQRETGSAESKCLTKGCENHRHQGKFIGDLCAPCNSYITTGNVGPTESFIGDLQRERDEARKLAERYRNLSCDSQEEADEKLLPWETTNPNEL